MSNAARSLALFSERDQIDDGLVGADQFAADDGGGRDPEHHMKAFRRIAQPFAQFTGAIECFHRDRRRRTLGRDQAGRECKLQVELEPVLVETRWKAPCSLDPSLQMRGRLDHCRGRSSIAPGAQPVLDASLHQTRLGEMPRERLGLSLDEIWEMLFQCVGNRCM